MAYIPAVREGDWNCPGCSMHNFSFRYQCKRCGVDRPGDDNGGGKGGKGGFNDNGYNAPYDGYAGGVSSTHQGDHYGNGKGYDAGSRGGQYGGGGEYSAGNRDLKPGDWICSSCSNNNFARRFQCHRCGADKQQGQTVGGEAAPYGHFPPQNYVPPNLDLKPGDWICSGCSNNNFARRLECNRCKMPRSDRDQLVGKGKGGQDFGYQNQSGYGRGGGPSYGDMGYNAVGGGWSNDFPVVDQSYGKGVGKGGYGAGFGQGGVGGNMDRKPGDWDCQQCGNNNFARRTECNRCGATNTASPVAAALPYSQPAQSLPTSQFQQPHTSYASNNQESFNDFGVANNWQQNTSPQYKSTPSQFSTSTPSGTLPSTSTTNPAAAVSRESSIKESDGRAKKDDMSEQQKPIENSSKTSSTTNSNKREIVEDETEENGEQTSKRVKSDDSRAEKEEDKGAKSPLEETKK